MRPATMHRAAVVPDYQIADPPLVAVDEFRLGGVGVEIEEQQTPLGNRPADDVRGVRRQIERLAMRTGMTAHQPLP